MPQRATLTMRDAALVAGVPREQVTMWRARRRTRHGTVPFPDVVATIDGVDHLDRDAFLEYLRVTGRGTNPSAVFDAAALAVPEGVTADDVATLLALQAATGIELGATSASELIALAEEVDPSDEMLLAEVRALVLTDALAGYVDDLVEASFGPGDAAARFETSRLRRGGRGMTEELVGVVVAIAGAARDALGRDEVALVPYVGPTAFGRLADGFASVVPAGSGERAWRRRTLVDGSGPRPSVGAMVHVLSVIDLPEGDALDRADELLVDLGPSDVGIVIGTASTLCDPLVGDAERQRTATLTDHALAAALRLPRGWWRAAHRQSLAVWILHGARSNEFVSVADLEGVRIDDVDLASDVAAALMEPAAGATTGHRAPRYARRTPTTSMIGRAAVVPRGTVAVRLGGPRDGSHLDRIHVATLTTSRGVDGCDVTVARSPGTITSRRRSLGELKDDRALTLRRGVGIDRTDADPLGTVPVQSADGSFDGVRLEPFSAAERYPRAMRTEPGDVVMLEKPSPRARVDLVGGALVASPSRVLRLLPGALVGPHALAAVINALAARGTAWTTWTVPVLADTESAALDAALAVVAAHTVELRRHLGAANDLLASLIEGVAAGAVTLDPTLIDKEAG